MRFRSFALLIATLLVAPTAGTARAQEGAQDAPSFESGDYENVQDEEGDAWDGADEDQGSDGATGRPIVQAEGYPIPYVLRPITIPKKMIRLDAEGIISHYPLISDSNPANVYGGINLGVAVGLSDDVEAGLSGYRLGGHRGRTYQGAVPLGLNPKVDFGDIRIYTRYRVVEDEEFELGIDVSFMLPVDTHFALQAAVPFRARLSERFILDAGLEFLLEFGRESFDPITMTTDEETVISLLVPVRGILQIVDSLWIAGQSGVDLLEFDFDLFTLPLSLELGYTVNNGDAPFMDIVLGFHFPLFIQPQADDAFPSEIWQITLGINGYFQL